MQDLTLSGFQYRKDHSFAEFSTGDDIATSFYSDVLGRRYLDATPTPLDTGFFDRQVIGLGVTGLFAWSPAAATTVALGGWMHTTGSYLSSMDSTARPHYLPPTWSIDGRGQPVFQL